MREIKEFKIRCSAIGQIMTNSRKKGELSKTCQTYLHKWLKKELTGKSKPINSKYLAKGILQEDQAIEIVSNCRNEFLIKNEAHYLDTHMTGTPDIRIGDKLIIDIKSSWDIDTFPMFKRELDNKDYFWQVQGYMALTGCEAAQIIYVLVDTPEHMIESAARSHAWQMGEEEVDLELYDQYCNNMTFSDMQDCDRIKVFDVPRCEESIKSIYNRVDECRQYIKTLLS